MKDAGAKAYNAAIERGEGEAQAKYNSEQAMKSSAVIDSAETAETEASALTLGDASSMLGPQIEALSKLGPEGELVAAATTGVMNIASAFEVLGTKGGSAASKSHSRNEYT